MKRYDVICPACGRVNRSLFLAETDGWYECDRCGAIVQDEDYCSHDRAVIWRKRIGKISEASVSQTGRTS